MLEPFGAKQRHMARPRMFSRLRFNGQDGAGVGMGGGVGGRMGGGVVSCGDWCWSVCWLSIAYLEQGFLAFSLRRRAIAGERGGRSLPEAPGHRHNICIFVVFCLCFVNVRSLNLF